MGVKNHSRKLLTFSRQNGYIYDKLKCVVLIAKIGPGQENLTASMLSIAGTLFTRSHVMKIRLLKSAIKYKCNTLFS
jgi:hypothetical protein